MKISIIGGGLAGCEAAWQAAERGVQVQLFEMRPGVETGAHVTSGLAELVCSNSLGSNLSDRASGLLKDELRYLGSLLLSCAEATSVPAGGALAVDRVAFSQRVTETIEEHPLITVTRKEAKMIPKEPTIVASGPLTSAAMSTSIAKLTGKDHLFFYDAISPIVAYESINLDTAFRSSRYSRHSQNENVSQDGGDYINCPFNQDQYYEFVNSLIKAKRIKLKDFERSIETGVKAGIHRFFEGCLPVEIMAERGKKSLAFGPMRPVGLTDPNTGQRPFAVVQLRQDNLSGSLYNMVGFQTNLTFSEQRRVFRMIPGLEKAIFERYGQMHRNTFIYSPELLHPSLQSKIRGNLFFAGQITGVEGYIGNIATGLLAGRNIHRYLSGQNLLVLPLDTMLGALCHYVSSSSSEDFQPMKANFGLLPPLKESPRKIKRRERGKYYAARAMESLKNFA